MGVTQCETHYSASEFSNSLELPIQSHVLIYHDGVGRDCVLTCMWRDVCGVNMNAYLVCRDPGQQPAQPRPWATSAPITARAAAVSIPWAACCESSHVGNSKQLAPVRYVVLARTVVAFVLSVRQIPPPVAVSMNVRESLEARHAGRIHIQVALSLICIAWEVARVREQANWSHADRSSPPGSR